MKVQRELDFVRGEIRKLRQAIAQRPIKPPKGSTTAITRLTITGGNTLSDGSTLGIKRLSTTVSSVPSAYDPSVTTSFIDGIGRGQRVVDGVTQSGFVLIVNDSRSGVGGALVAADRALSYSTVAIAVSGDPDGATVTCYIPYFQ